MGNYARLMPRPFELIETVMTAEGPLELRKRGAGDFMILRGGQVLMTSVIQNSEIELGKVACAKVRDRTPVRVLIGGLGLGFTLRAALDALPARAEVVVAELNEVVVQWCRGPLAELTGHSLADPRVRVIVGDVVAVIRDAAAHGQARFDAIIWDLYRGPAGNETGPSDPLYGRTSIERTHRALNAGGVYAVWGEAPDPSFTARLERCGFRVEQTRSSGKGTKHAVFIAIK
jgi:spermidine synthase